jgi:hypothetical protein
MKYTAYFFGFLGYFLSLFIPLKAQNFESFVKQFPVAELPFSVNSKIIDNGSKNLKLIQYPDIEAFLLQKPKDSTSVDFYPYQNYTTNQEADFIKKQKIQYFFYKRVNIYPNFISLVVFFKDNLIQIGQGILSNDFVCYNFTKNGELMSVFGFGKQEYFMSERITEISLDKNKTLKYVEKDYNVARKNERKKLNYTKEDYFELTENLQKVSINYKYYPYAGNYECGNDEMSIEQNIGLFMVMRGIKGGGGQTSQQLLASDLKKGTFTIKTEDLGILQGQFSEDKKIITLTKTDKTVLIYKKTN